MKEKRDDITWLVALLEKQKAHKKVRPIRAYSHLEQSAPTVERLRKRRRQMWIMFAFAIILTTIVQLVVH